MMILRNIGILILMMVVVLAYLIFFTGPGIPDNDKNIIRNVLKADVPEFVRGQTGYISSAGWKIWYEAIDPVDTVKGTALLFMGLSNDALGWPQPFLDDIVKAGYRVIRYDYRGTGMSDWDNGKGTKSFSLEDLAHDAVIILDSLKIEKAHLLGISLGGMVAQEYAIHYPQRTATLATVMSSGYITDPDLPGFRRKFVYELVKNNIRYSIIPTEKNILKRNVAVRILLRGDAIYDIDAKGISEQVLYNLRRRRGYNVKSSRQQQDATYRSGSRYEALGKLKIPTLVVHGMNDPFIPVEHSKKLASVIPGAKTLWVNNMGHDLPPYLTDSLARLLTQHFRESR